MKKLKKIFYVIITIFIIVLSLSTIVLADDIGKLVQNVEYTEEFKEWLKLSDEEKQKTIMPRQYEIKNINIQSKNPFREMSILKANGSSKYSLKDIIPNNLIIRNQKNTNSCWAFAALSSLETNLAIANYKSGTNLSKVYDYSERHMEYATSNSFSNSGTNFTGYNRKVGSGGRFDIATSYLTNGTGAILEKDMPFENNEDIIDVNQIQNKKVSSQVYDTIAFPNYRAQLTEEAKLQVMNKIKQHIQNYGAVQASIHGNSSNYSIFSCYNNKTGALYCNNKYMHPTDHAISIIGWDDNYSIENFAENSRPSSKGAWIARNSWGDKINEMKLTELKQKIFDENKQQCISQGWETYDKIPNSFIEQNGYTIDGENVYIKYGDNGLIYISYEDDNVAREMFGIEKASDTVEYDNIYQYDELAPSCAIQASSKNVMLSNTFDKKTDGTEYLTKVALYAPEVYTCKVYVNPNGTSKAKKDLQQVKLKTGYEKTIDAGYHTLEFANPIEIKSKSFTIVIEIQSTGTSTSFSLESKITDTDSWWSSAKIENDKCFFALGNDLDNCEWVDLSKFKEVNTSLENGDSTIKAFTKNQLWDNSLKNIEIKEKPEKLNYYEGDNFESKGLVVQANYNSKTNPSVILKDLDYSIVNGTNLKAGQKSVTISYQDKSINLPISVEKNSVIKLEIKNQPNKTEYKEGQSFDKTGMVIEATYKNGTTKTISDYKIENGNSLDPEQTSVTIVYDGQKIEQSIKVTPNPLIELRISKAPNKQKYVVGQNFDKTGMVIIGKYQDGSEQEIIDYTIENGNNLTKEQTEVTITFKGKTIKQEIFVEDKKVEEISIKTFPSKKQYIQNKEELELNDGILQIKYNDDSTEEIPLTNEQIKVSGFDNEKIGKNTITIEYQNKKTTFDVEIIEEIKNSSFSNMKIKINNAKYYEFSNKEMESYFTINITLSDILKNTENAKFDYYYYLSTEQNENNIQDWVKINEEQKTDGKIEFEINTKDIKNYEKLIDADNLYLYIKEVIQKEGNQSVEVTKPIEVKLDVTIEKYLDNAKVNNSKSDNKEDNTIAKDNLPKTGVRGVLVFTIVIILTLGVIFYVRYRVLKSYIK